MRINKEDIKYLFALFNFAQQLEREDAKTLADIARGMVLSYANHAEAGNRPRIERK